LPRKSQGTGAERLLKNLARPTARQRPPFEMSFIKSRIMACSMNAILRTNGFPKGRAAQVGRALRNLEAVNGPKLDLSDTEWHGFNALVIFRHSMGPSLYWPSKDLEK
jgi:hypothetical protein